MRNRSDKRLEDVEFEFKGNFTTYNDERELGFWREWCEKVERTVGDMENEDLELE